MSHADDVGSGLPGAGQVSLALQGGASYGAYTWGVLDALLEDGRLSIEGVTGASSGAINAVVLAAGYANGGPAAARRLLERFWEGLAEAAARRRRGTLRNLGALLGSLLRGSSSRSLHAFTTRLVADFEIDPQRMEPLRSVLHEVIDFEALSRSAPFRVFVNATNCRTHEIRVFAESEMSADVVCASSCIPLFFEAVEIEGEYYWDGGFLGNPALFPVIYGCKASDIVLIESSPQKTPDAPSSATEILSSLVDVGSRAALLRELRMIDFVSEMVREARGALPPGVREIRVHRIAPARALTATPGAGSLRADLEYFRTLRDVGREAGEQWLRTRAAFPAGALEGMDGPCTTH